LRFLQTQTGIPANISGADAETQSRNLVETIKKFVQGEEAAAEIVGEADLIRARNVDKAEGPRLAILLAGSPGNGKSEFSKAATIGQYGTVEKLIRIDVAKMNTVWGLIGSEGGYKDSDRASLIEPLRRDPNHNILFDEFDKNRVLDGFLLPALEEGKTTDGMGRPVFFTDATMIFTANWAEEYSLYKDVWTDAEAEQRYGLRAGALEGKTEAEKDTLIIEADMRRSGVSEALISRIPVKILLKKKTLAQVESIARAQLNEQHKYLFDEKGILVQFDESVVKFLARQSYDPAMGMRPLRWNRRANISSLLAKTLGPNVLKKGDAVTMKFAAGADGQTGRLTLELAGREIGARDVVLKVLADPKFAAGRAAVEVNKPIDFTDKAAIDDLTRRLIETSKAGKR
jgi:ATP-dependent Clp protease ATP-binding subunit ClpA